MIAIALRQGLHPAFWGLVFGLALSLGLMRLMAGLLYHVKPLDAEVLLAVSFTLLIVTARRAAQVDPVTALRYE
jgi:ABC-type antimicrobial peptide transport system permease subunit